jgi:DNA primase
VPVSFPVSWDDLDAVTPADFTIRTAPGLLTNRSTWSDEIARRQRVPDVLIEEGSEIPVARVQAMHEGKRRARARGNRAP